MSPKLTFTIYSAIAFLFSASAYVAPEFFTTMAFPAANGLALDVGISTRYFSGATYLLCAAYFSKPETMKERATNKTSFWVGSKEVYHQLLAPV